MSLGAIGTVPNNSIIQGAMKLGIVDGVTTSTWNPRSGGTSKTIFYGTQAQVTALAQDAKTDGWEYNIQGGEIWTLEVIFPWDIVVDQNESQSNPLFVWEMVNTPFDRDIFDCTDQKFIAELSTFTKDQIDLKIRNNDTNSPAWAEQDRNNPAIRTDATVAYNLKRAGVRGKQGTVQSLKRTLIIPNDFDFTGFWISAADGKVMSKTTLIGLSNPTGNVLNDIPDIITNAMPSGLFTNVYGNPAPTTFVPEGFSLDKNGINTFIGWLQYPPEYRMVSNSKVQVTTIWVFNKWSAGNWGLYTAYPGGVGTDPSAALGLTTTP